MLPRRVLLLRLMLAVAMLAACAAAPRHPIAIAVLVDGDRAAAPIEPAAVAGLELHVIELAAPTPAESDATTGVLARARAAYAQGNHDTCRTEVARVEVPRLLAIGNRAAAARALTLDAACAFQGSAKEDARTAAARLAGFGLDLPADAVAIEVEQLINDAIEVANQRPRARLAIAGEPGARVSVDGRAAMCVAPCTVELAPGEHVIALEADGFEPAWRVVRIPDSTDVAIAQQPASPARASSQWRARLGRGMPATDTVGAALIALAAAQPRVAYVHAGAQLTGTMIVDGKARASSSARTAGPLVRELAYDANILQRPRVWQRPWFWIAVAGATLAVSGAIVYVIYEPEVQTMVGF